VTEGSKEKPIRSGSGSTTGAPKDGGAGSKIVSFVSSGEAQPVAATVIRSESKNRLINVRRLSRDRPSYASNPGFATAPA
jgi:hypothetical protein